MSVHPLFVIAVLGANVALSEWLVRRTALRHLGSALLVIVITAIVANLGLIPTVTDGSPVYDGIFRWLAPLSIFWLLLGVDLRSVLRAGAPMLLLFLLGALGTLVGVLAGIHLVGGSTAFGESYAALGGMFVGTYVGGSVNFNALAIEYGVAENGPLFAGASVVDSAMTTVWMAATVAIPRLLGHVWPRREDVRGVVEASESAALDDTETVHPFDVAVLLALGGATLAVSDVVSAWCATRGAAVPDILILTTLALVLAQWPVVRRVRGARLCGMVAVMIFLAVIGALCDVRALAHIGALGARLAAFVVVAVCLHGLVVFGGAALFRLDPTMAAVASQANVGGGTSALALARSLGRADLVLPAILLGSLGTGLGTYLGFLTVFLLGG